MQIRFETTQPGVYTGSATILTNDPDEPSYSFSLAGTATGTVDTEAPRTFIGNPLANATVSGTVVVRGWALDAASLSAASLSFQLDGQPLALTDVIYGLNRQGACDMHSDLGSPDCPNVGWRGDLDTTTLPNGSHTFTLRAVDPSGNVRLRSVTFVTESGLDTTLPVAFIDRPSPGQTVSGIAYLEGWAIDNTILDASSMTFKLDGSPISVDQLRYGRYRQDRCDVYPQLASPNCPFVGWFALLPTGSLSNGSHVLELTIRDAAGNVATYTRSFVVSNSVPTGLRPLATIESPALDQVVSGTLLLQGWALDDSTLSIANIRFFLNTWEVFLGVTYGNSRNDVCLAFPQYSSPNCPGVGWLGSSTTAGADNGWNNLRILVEDQDGNTYTFDRAFFIQN